MRVGSWGDLRSVKVREGGLASVSFDEEVERRQEIKLLAVLGGKFRSYGLWKKDSAER